MLKKDPNVRPSAIELNEQYLPPLMEPEEQTEPTTNQEEEIIENTERKYELLWQ